MADIYPKQYLMTAGPTPLPPAVSQVMAEPILYHRAPAFVEIYERVLERLPQVFRTDNDVLCFASTGSGGDRVRRRQPDPPRRARARRLLRQVRRALGRALRGLRRRPRARSSSSGARRSTRRASTRRSARMERKPKVVFTTQSETSTGVVNDIAALAEVARGHDAMLCVDAVSGLGAAELQAGRVGGGRRRLRLAEVADVPARARLRLGLAARARPRRRRSPAAATTSTGTRRRPGSGSRRRTRRSPPP